MNLHSTQLVILSLPLEPSEQQGEQPALDLAKSFLVAGAAHVIVSIFDFHDAEGFRFITTFYEEFLCPHKSIDVASALAAAQRELVRHPATFRRCLNDMSWA